MALHEQRQTTSYEQTHLVPGGFQSVIGRSIRADATGLVEGNRSTNGQSKVAVLLTVDGHVT